MNDHTMKSRNEVRRGWRVLGALLAMWASSTVAQSHGNDPAMFPAMIQAFTEELAKAPDADLFIQRGEIYLHLREWTKAEADFAAAGRLDPQRVITSILHARALIDGGRPAAARPLIDQYLTQKPSNAEAWFMRGEILAATGNPDLALADYAEGFRRGSAASVEQLFRWSSLLAAAPMSEAGRALVIVDDAIARIGPATALLNCAIDLEVRSGRFEAALTRIGEVMQRTKRQEMWLVRQGDVLVKAGRRADAIAAYRRALEAIDTLPERERSTNDAQLLARAARTAVDRLGVN